VLFGIAGQAAYGLDDYETAEKYLSLASKAGKLDEKGQEMLAELPKQKEAWAAEQAIRTKEAAANDLPRVKLETTKGPIVIELLENEAPQAVGNFVSLVEKKFYDGLTFHRVLPNFMAQGGDPKGDGTGGPGYHIFCECQQENARKHFRGTLSMAHAGRDTGGSQFFLTFRPTAYLNGRHTVFGRVVEGFDVLAKLQRINPQAANQPAPDKIVKAEVVRKREHKYEPKKVE
jgi:cyclophilin family peptidyl-prolyl cis-trans isomerase